MNEEIKEILEQLEWYKKIGKKDVMFPEYLLTNKKAFILLDYITNLQQENEYSNYCNEKLREKISNLEYKITELEEINKQHQELNGILQKENESIREKAKNYLDIYDEMFDYKERCDKAIEYITSYEAISTIQGLDKIEQNKTLDERTMNVMVERYLQVHHKLLNILQDKEESK